MREFIQRNKFSLLAALAGGIAGFLYWRFIGCTSGSCPIKSVWYWSTLWGTAAGYLVGDLTADIIKRTKKKKDAGEV
jgi:CDP-diglyceride synthetase